MNVGAFSNELRVVAALIPDQVTQPTKFSSSISEITIRWTAPNHNGSAITQYNVYWNAGSGSNYVLVG